MALDVYDMIHNTILYAKLQYLEKLFLDTFLQFPNTNLKEPSFLNLNIFLQIFELGYTFSSYNTFSSELTD